MIKIMIISNISSLANVKIIPGEAILKEIINYDLWRIDGKTSKQGWVWVLIGSVPGLCILFTFIIKSNVRVFTETFTIF